MYRKYGPVLGQMVSDGGNVRSSVQQQEFQYVHANRLTHGFKKLEIECFDQVFRSQISLGMNSFSYSR